MRLFFIEWSGREFGLTDVVKELRAQGHEIVYWSGYELDSNVNKHEFPETIFHDYFDARAGRSARGVDDSEFDPPGEELIRGLFETEAALLIMMNKQYEWMRENQKKHLYYRYLQYWNGVFAKYKPDAIIGPSAPHTVYDLVVFELARLRGIKTIMFELTAIADRSIVMNDFRDGCPALKTQLALDEGVNFSPADLAPDIKRYYDRQMNPNGSPTPPIVTETLARYSPLRTLRLKALAVGKSIYNGSFFEWAMRRLSRKGDLRQEYLSTQTEPDFEKPYVYFPLQNQPECTTSPLGGIFADQLLALELLSRALPDCWRVYVKEHPFQWKPRGVAYFSFRYQGFYRAISALPNASLVPIETDTFGLIRGARAIASVAGTAPWEGVLRGKPGIVFGYPWYRDCHGIFQARDAASCGRAFSDIAKGFSVDRQKIINYLGSFQKAVLESYRDPYNKKISSISLEQNIKNHVELIAKELSS